ncbi:GGDEF domain-containing protein [Amycolatopsis sp. CA-230715]|uniref:GGDEF domain-containing protein n=1 Tax=Amycolatopsis sp. CA-230715 TaxID=2745196 RepID=UPI001C027BC2|nr:GGDEF domain-containing protein [Amycolatopsis sp. CA-230715]QWF83324.1 hypothetical protein HUW46_06764 [Amycolatopsis sp. CA-230715]
MRDESHDQVAARQPSPFWPRGPAAREWVVRGWGIREWALWQQPPRVVAYCLACAAAVVSLGFVWFPVAAGGADLIRLAVLAGLGILQAELGRHVERVRRRLSGSPHITMSSVWTFAGVLMMPIGLVVVLTAVLYLHLGLRSWYRLHRVPPFRTFNNACCVILSSCGAASTLDLIGVPTMRAATTMAVHGAIAVLVVMAVQFGLNAVLILPARAKVGRTPRAWFGGWFDNVLDLATLCLGALNALALAISPVLVVAVFPPVLLLHRTVLVTQLEAEARRDHKTGVFNIAGWQAHAERVEARANRLNANFGLLMIDLDHFKRVNDTYGHLAGDAVLKAIADAIVRSVRGHEDAVGRFGGEEFVVILPNVTGDGIAMVAERIRTAVHELTVRIPVGDRGQVVTGFSVSVGSARYPSAGTTVQALLDAADIALYQAKQAGRNRVVAATARA